MKRVLVVAYYFPPVAAAGSIRVAGLAGELPALGWEPTVLAPARTPHAEDAGMRFPEEHVVRSRSIELSRAGRAFGSAPAPGSASADAAGGSARARIAAAARSFAHRRIYYPDAQIGWYPGAVRAGRRALAADRFDAIWSSSFPITSHLIARKLSRATGIPWIAEFRDPWSDVLTPEHAHKARAAKLEQAIAAEAAAVVMPTSTWANLFGARWARPVDVVPNGFDGDPPPAQPDPDPPVITHLGSYYPGRQDYSVLWSAIGELRERSPRLRIVGDLNGAMRDELDRAGILDLVDATGWVPHDEVGRLVQASSLLVASAFNETDAVANGVIPAKLFDYLATERPILYLSRPGTEGARLLEGQDGCWVADPADADAVMRAVTDALHKPRATRDPQRWSRREAATRLAAVLDRVT